MKKLLYGLLGLLLVAFIAVQIASRTMFSVDLPEYEAVEVKWLDQNWTADDWQWYYHASQGGAFELILPYTWLMALEQPRLPFFIVGTMPRLMEEDYIARFGFLPNAVTQYNPDGLSYTWALNDYSTSREDAVNNPDRLPVGLVRTPNYDNPITGERLDVAGFNCSACHTGQINYQGTGIRIEGGSAMVDLGKFKTAVGLALFYTRYAPGRFGRFADAVLGEGHSSAARDSLKAQMDEAIVAGRALKDMVTERGIYPTEEGFSRLDALGRIGNFVFGDEIDVANFDTSDAPVNFPHIWDTPWFEWVQYNASIKQPIVRNAGEAMGVFARVNFDPNNATSELFTSTMNIQNLYEMESLIRGERRYEGLRSPQWPEDILGPIDPEKAAAGARLYRENCQSCHLPPMDDSSFFHRSYWTEVDEYDNQYLKLPITPLDKLGTDPNQTRNFITRLVKMGAVGEIDFTDVGRLIVDKDTIPITNGPEIEAGRALPLLVAETVKKRYQDIGLPDSLWYYYDGLRPNDIQAPMAYKARPLNGIWATPPYLHNGSVPNLYQLLSPVAERDAAFYLGTKEYDPVHVGYVLGKVSGGFRLDTSRSGNSNAGHENRGSNDKNADDYWQNLGQGVIGRALTPDERWALVEYLKTL